MGCGLQRKQTNKFCETTYSSDQYDVIQITNYSNTKTIVCTFIFKRIIIERKMFGSIEKF